MTFKDSLIDPVGGIQYGFFRFQCKKMASLVLAQDKRRGRFPLKRIAREIIEGTVTVHDLTRWVPLARDELSKTN